MEIYEDEVYENLQKGYEESKTAQNGLNRAMLGVLPFDMKEGEGIKSARRILCECERINCELKRRVRPYSGIAPEIVRNILDESADIYKKLGCKGERVENATGGDYFVTASKKLCEKLDEALSLWFTPEIVLLTVKAYAMLNLFISG